MLSQQLAWLILAASVVAEALGTAALKLSSGFNRPIPSILTVVCYTAAVWLMATATRRLEMGTAYAAWAGTSAALTAMIGIVCFAETVSMLKLIGLGMAVFGIVLLNMSGGTS
ncbi:multidrug efflux SMR transporter [Paraburkholderia sediminicola]|nr:multidrug efflux SMR transporter [Paraburkholderia sediminicola]